MTTQEIMNVNWGWFLRDYSELGLWLRRGVCALVSATASTTTASALEWVLERLLVLLALLEAAATRTASLHPESLLVLTFQQLGRVQLHAVHLKTRLEDLDDFQRAGRRRHAQVAVLVTDLVLDERDALAFGGLLAELLVDRVLNVITRDLTLDAVKGNDQALLVRDLDLELLVWSQQVELHLLATKLGVLERRQLLVQIDGTLLVVDHELGLVHAVELDERRALRWVHGLGDELLDIVHAHTWRDVGNVDRLALRLTLTLRVLLVLLLRARARGNRSGVGDELERESRAVNDDWVRSDQIADLVGERDLREQHVQLLGGRHELEAGAQHGVLLPDWEEGIEVGGHVLDWHVLGDQHSARALLELGLFVVRQSVELVQWLHSRRVAQDHDLLGLGLHALERLQVLELNVGNTRELLVELLTVDVQRLGVHGRERLLDLVDSRHLLAETGEHRGTRLAVIAVRKRVLAAQRVLRLVDLDNVRAFQRGGQLLGARGQGGELLEREEHGERHEASLALLGLLLEELVATEVAVGEVELHLLLDLGRERRHGACNESRRVGWIENARFPGLIPVRRATHQSRSDPIIGV